MMGDIRYFRPKVVHIIVLFFYYNSLPRIPIILVNESNIFLNNPLKNAACHVTENLNLLPETITMSNNLVAAFSLSLQGSDTGEK